MMVRVQNLQEKEKHKMINDKMNFNFEFCPLITQKKQIYILKISGVWLNTGLGGIRKRKDFTS